MRLLCLALSAFLIWSNGWASPLSDVQSRENYIKAAILYRITNYIEWPNAALTKNLCTTDKEDYNALYEWFSQRPKKINILLSPSSLVGCHIVYISRRTKNLSDLFQQARKYNTLTISQGGDFIIQGGMIGITFAEGKAALQLNLGNSHKAGLEINPQLIEIAERVVQ